MADITSANAVFMLSIPNLYPVPQQLQGWSTDDAFTTGNSESAEVMIGVDGVTSYGFTPFLVPMTLNFQADSLSNVIFETLLEQQKLTLGIYPMNATIVLPAIRRKYTLTTGIAMGVTQIPGARKVLQPRAYELRWANISPAAI